MFTLVLVGLVWVGLDVIGGLDDWCLVLFLLVVVGLVMWLLVWLGLFCSPLLGVLGLGCGLGIVCVLDMSSFCYFGLWIFV